MSRDSSDRLTASNLPNSSLFESDGFRYIESTTNAAGSSSKMREQECLGQQLGLDGLKGGGTADRCEERGSQLLCPGCNLVVVRLAVGGVSAVRIVAHNHLLVDHKLYNFFLFLVLMLFSNVVWNETPSNFRAQGSRLRNKVQKT